MSGFKPIPPDEGRARCHNCSLDFKAKDAGWIRMPEQRLTASEEIPVGECPGCGSCAYLIKPVKRMNDQDLKNMLTEYFNDHDRVCLDTVQDALAMVIDDVMGSAPDCDPDDEKCDTCGAGPNETHPASCADHEEEVGSRCDVCDAWHHEGDLVAGAEGTTREGDALCAECDKKNSEKWYCAGSFCPGLSYKASQHPHPSTCANLAAIGEDRPAVEASDLACGVCGVAEETGIVEQHDCPRTIGEDRPAVEASDIGWVDAVVTVKEKTGKTHVLDIDVAGKYRYEVLHTDQAEEHALDTFHSRVPIKVLEDFDISVEIKP